jgi:hypothetical protein
MHGAVHRQQLIISRSVLLRMKNVSDKSCRETRDTRFRFNDFYPKIVPFMRYVEKYCRAGQATDGSMAHAHCVLDT